MSRKEQSNKKLIVLICFLLLLTGCQPRSVAPVQTPGEEGTSSVVAKGGEEPIDLSQLLQKEQGGERENLQSTPEDNLISSQEDPPQASPSQEDPPQASPSQEDPPKTSSSQEEDPVPSEKSPLPQDGDWNLLLVNYNHSIDSEFAPELAEVQGGYKMDARVADIMKQMISDAASQGVSLMVCSAYRPYSSQQRNFNNSVSQYIAAGYSKEAAAEETLRLIAAPGTSEHQTGLAADIVTPAYQGLNDGYADTAAAKWLLANAGEYGFILRYPKDKTELTKIDFEPWHYRYVGVEAAQVIMSQGLCLEEYLEQ